MTASIEHKIISFFEGELSNEEIQKLQIERKNLESVEALFQEYAIIYKDIENQIYVAPRPTTSISFEEILQKEKNNQISQHKVHKLRRITLRSIIPYAATILFLLSIGFAIKAYVSQNNEIRQVNEELLAIKQNMEALLKNESTSMRIKAVSMSYDMKKIDEDVIATLVKTMNSDFSENVRLAAIDALGKFVKEETVKNALINALENQDNSFIQIKIINILVEANTKEALPSFDQLIEDENTLHFVKEEAIQGKAKITSI